MILISEVIQQVQSAYSKGVQSKDSRLTSRHIYSAALMARSTLIRQQANKNQFLSQWIYQELPSVQLVSSAPHEAVGVPAGGSILRTKYKIPSLVSDINKNLLRAASSVNGDEKFDLQLFKDSKYNKGNKYTSKTATSYMRNGYLYITNLKMRKVIAIEGIFEDPIAVFDFPRYVPCTECECADIMDIEFPIDENLMAALIDITIQKLVILLGQMKSDDTNNAEDDTGVARTMVHQPQQ